MRTGRYLSPQPRTSDLDQPLSIHAGDASSLMMMLAVFLFTTMGICIRLSSAFVPVIEVVFFRNFLAVLIMAPVLIRKGLPSIKMNRKRLFFGRAPINFIGMLSGFTAVTMIRLPK